MVITSSQVKEINLEFWTTSLITFKTSTCMYFAISQLAPLDQSFLGRNQNFKNSYKGYKFS
jgi:hypothetical protein